MAPIPQTVYSLLRQREFAPNTTFTEKAIILIIFTHICLLYTIIWWMLASKSWRGSPVLCTPYSKYMEYKRTAFDVV